MKSQKLPLKKWLIKLFEHLEVDVESIVVAQDETDTYQAQIDMDEKEAGAIIGYHGDTIASLQLLLGATSFNQSGAWERIVVNVNDYREKRQESLEQMAKDTAEKAKQSGQPIALFNLNPYERRLVHMALSEDDQITTESEGEGNDRHLIVNPTVNEEV